MNKAKTYFWIDILMLIFFIIVAITGIAIFIDVRGGNLRTIHNYSGLVLIIIMAIHFILHYKWVISLGKSIFKK